MRKAGGSRSVLNSGNQLTSHDGTAMPVGRFGVAIYATSFPWTAAGSRCVRHGPWQSITVIPPTLVFDRPTNSSMVSPTESREQNVSHWYDPVAGLGVRRAISICSVNRALFRLFCRCDHFAGNGQLKPACLWPWRCEVTTPRSNVEMSTGRGWESRCRGRS